LGHNDYASTLAADPLPGGVWLGFLGGGITYLRDGQIGTSHATGDALGAGPVNRFQFDPDGTVWVATEGGLSRLKNGRIATLTSDSGLPCNAVHWAIEDNDRSFWLYMPCGLTHIARAELDAWGADLDQERDSRRTIRGTVFDISDGVRTLANPGFYKPQVAKSLDGKLWFFRWDGVSVIDPQHIPFNRLPPPVYIEQIIADSKTHDLAAGGNENVRLPPLIRDLQIDYTALSFVDPAKVLFRYKLEGRDGLTEIGHPQRAANHLDFCFDNETPLHKVYLEPFRIANRNVTCHEYLEFMSDDAYTRPELWLADGWDTVRQMGWEAPLYWERDPSDETGWRVFTLRGWHGLSTLLDTPVCHVS
jgi:hypothetical protein